MKRIVSCIRHDGNAVRRGFAILGAGPMGTANAATLSRQATQRGPYAAAHRGGYAAPQRSPYASARGGPNASETKPAEQARPPSIPYDPDGPAYMPGQTSTTDFQLQH